MEEMYSNTSGMGKKENREDEKAVRAFALYYHKYLKGQDAFILPQWFVDARKKFTFEEVNEIFKAEDKK